MIKAPAIQGEYFWEISTSANMAWVHPYAGYNEALAKAKKAFEYEAQVKVFSDELDKVLYLSAYELPKRHRHRFIVGLQRIAGFLDNIGFSKHAVGEVIELAHALEELDRGTVRDFLKPNAAGSRTIEAGDKWVVRALLAIAMEALCQHGESQRKSGALLAEMLRPVRLGFISPNRSIETALVGWHRQFREGSVKDLRACLVFEAGEKIATETVQRLTSERGSPPTIHDVAVDIAMRAVRESVKAATNAEHQEMYKTMKKQKKR